MMNESAASLVVVVSFQTFRSWLVKGRYTKGVPFQSKMVYKRVRVRPLGGASPCKISLSTPRG